MKIYLNILSVLFFLNICQGFSITKYDLPVQEDGRIKPFSTYSSNQLLKFYNKRQYNDTSLNQTLNSTEWLYEVITKPEEWISYPLFNIVNNDVVVSLGLDENKRHKYSFYEIIDGFKENQDLVNSLKNKKNEDLSLVESQIIDVYNKIIYFDEVAHSMICLLPIIEVKNNVIKEFMNISSEKVSYSYFVRNIDQFRVLLDDLLNTNENEWNESHIELSQIAMHLQSLTQYSYAQKIKIIPSDNMLENNIWLSPWEVLNGQFISSNQNSIMKEYEDLFYNYLNNNRLLVDNQIANIMELVSISDNNFKSHLIVKESWYNKIDIFSKSMILYMISFFILGIGWMYKPQICRNISFYLILVGFLLHSYGLTLRMIIMQRPPVSTLYESILFVCFVLVLFSIIFEIIRKDGLGVFIASVGGTILHFVGLKYAIDGDTLGMLVAVLNSNFWLATHVTTITIGYGVSLVAGLMAHLYLFYSVLKPEKKLLTKIFNNIYGLTLMALFFTMFGTILGGIWADQSWGRFWGWDPKENGALLIVLWLLMMLHIRVSGMAKPIGYAFGVSLVNIIVAIAWFGVNLLNVGLHSYGFTDNVAENLLIFILIELFLTSVFYVLGKRKIA